MSRRRRFVAAALVTAATAGGLVACAPEPPTDAWVLTPISYDNRLDGDGGAPEHIDLTYPMALTGDTAGGFWGHSAGSFVHIDADGTAVRRFNLDPGAPSGMTVALNPTTLVMTSQTDARFTSSVVLFDTDTMTFSDLSDDTRTIGALAAHGGDVYLAVYGFGEPTFTVETLSASAPGTPRQIGPAFDGHGPLAIDVDDAGTVYVATESERIVISDEGTILHREDVPSIRPAVAVNGDGDAVWTGQAPASADVPSFVRGGSGEARDIIATYSECAAGPNASESAVDVLTLATGATERSLPFLCGQARVTWIDDDQLVASVGTENGAVLVRITPPGQAR